jgi:hypothetical protein
MARPADALGLSPTGNCLQTDAFVYDGVNILPSRSPVVVSYPVPE